MVVGDQDGLEIIVAQAVCGELFLEAARADTRVDEDAGLAGVGLVEDSDEIAVPAAAG